MNDNALSSRCYAFAGERILEKTNMSETELLLLRNGSIQWWVEVVFMRCPDGSAQFKNGEGTELFRTTQPRMRYELEHDVVLLTARIEAEKVGLEAIEIELGDPKVDLIRPKRCLFQKPR